MSISVHYFASLREALGLAQETIELSDSVVDVAAVRALLAARGGDWASLSSMRFRAALNQSLVGESAMVKDGDELAFFPPVTGG